MWNPIVGRVNGAAARGLRCAGVLASTTMALAACGNHLTSRVAVAATGEAPHEYDFQVVHAQESTPDGRRALRLDSDKGTLEITYAGAGAKRTAVVKVGMQPVSVRAASDHEAWVVDPIADSISIVDLDSATVSATLRTAPQPTDVLFSGTPSLAYVSVAQGKALLVYDPHAPTTPPTRIALQIPPQRAQGEDI